MNEMIKNFKTTKLEDMPNEVLENIFRHFSVYEVQHNLAFVSKQFLKVSRIPGMVENVRIIIKPGKKKRTIHHILKKLDFEDEQKNIAFAKAKSVLKIHPTAKIDMVFSYHIFRKFSIPSPSYLLYLAKASETNENQIKEVKFLLRHLDDAKYAKNGEYYRTPLYESAQAGNVTLTRIFLKYNPSWVNINVKGTILHRILNFNLCILNFNLDHDTDSQKQIIKLLLEHGADVNALSDTNKTPLHVAAQSMILHYQAYSHIKLPSSKFLLLLENGASLDIKNQFGQTSLDIVKITKNLKFPISDRQKLIDLLENYQKEPNFQELKSKINSMF